MMRLMCVLHKNFNVATAARGSTQAHAVGPVHHISLSVPKLAGFAQHDDSLRFSEEGACWCLQGPSIYYPDVPVESNQKHGADIPVIIGVAPSDAPVVCMKHSAG